MKIFAISDLHLSINNPKPMDIFGPAWDNYIDNIINDWNDVVSEDDIVLIPGDISWAMKFEEAKADLDLICALKGKKVILKGNHDYWWSSISEVKEYLHNETYALQNNAHKFENVIICGSRGWTIPDNGIRTEQDEKIYRRELIRMELSLKSMEAQKQDDDICVVMTHFPPFNYRIEDSEMTDLFEKYGVNYVVFGHLHSFDKKQKMIMKKNGVCYFLTSCDLTGNKLIEIANIN